MAVHQEDKDEFGRSNCAGGREDRVVNEILNAGGVNPGVIMQTGLIKAQYRKLITRGHVVSELL